MTSEGVVARRAFIVVSLAFALSLTMIAPANAHSWVYYYKSEWPPSHLTIPYGFDDYFPLSKSGVYYGANVWNLTGGSDAPNFYNSLPQKPYQFAPCTLADYTGAIFFRDLNPEYGSSAIARTRTCPVGFTEHRFTISFDSSGRTWYVGTGDAPSNQYDMWSVASHEFGHATGWFYHLDYVSPGTSLCANNSGQHTMCEFYYVGTERMRTLGTHDIDTFESMY